MLPLWSCQTRLAPAAFVLPLLVALCTAQDYEEGGAGRVHALQSQLASALPGTARKGARLGSGSIGPAITLNIGKLPGQDPALDRDLAVAQQVYEVSMRKKQAAVEQAEKDGLSQLDVREFVLVATYPCPLVSRLGRWGRGGMWMCLKHYNFSSRPMAISVGFTHETLFEEEFAERLNGFSYLFDFGIRPRLEAKLHALPYLKFYRMGLAGVTEIQVLKARYKRIQPAVLMLPEVMKVAGQTYLDVFKVDCEACEVEVVKDMEILFTADTAPFGQILMQVHRINSDFATVAQLVGTLEGLGYRLFHVETNPDWFHAYDLAFIHERLVKPPPH